VGQVDNTASEPDGCEGSIGDSIQPIHTTESDSVHKGVSDSVHKGVSDSVYEGVSDNVHKPGSESVRKGVSDRVHEGVSDSVHKRGSCCDNLISDEEWTNAVSLLVVDEISHKLFGDATDGTPSRKVGLTYEMFKGWVREAPELLGFLQSVLPSISVHPGTHHDSATKQTNPVTTTNTSTVGTGSNVPQPVSVGSGTGAAAGVEDNGMGM
jgi:hypothetical protein